MSEKVKGHRRLTIVAVIVVNVIVICGVIAVYSLLQQSASAKLELQDFSYQNLGFDVVANSSYISVSGKIHNLQLETIENISLVIEVWAPVQNTNNMDLPLADRMVKVGEETFAVASIEGNDSRDFQFKVPYPTNPKYDTNHLEARAYFR
jgi:hypothetical protein